MTSGTTRAVVPPVVDYRESDRIVTLFTEQHGKSPPSRAARRSQKRFAGGLRACAWWRSRSTRARRQPETLREARPVLPCLALLTSLPRIEAAGAGLELLRATLAERQPEPEVFALTVDFLLALDAGHPPATRLLQFQLDVLDLLGFLLQPRAVRGVWEGRARGPRGVVSRLGGYCVRACGGGALRLSALTRRVVLAQRLHAPTAAELESGPVEIPAEWPKAVLTEARALVAGMLESIVSAPRGKGRGSLRSGPETAQRNVRTVLAFRASTWTSCGGPRAGPSQVIHAQSAPGRGRTSAPVEAWDAAPDFSPGCQFALFCRRFVLARERCRRSPSPSPSRTTPTPTTTTAVNLGFGASAGTSG